VAYIDGQPMRTPWLSVLTATDPALLPPDIRPAADRAVLVLAGTKAQMGDAYLELQNRRRFELRVEADDGHADHTHSLLAFSVPIERTLRIERNELNRWFMDQTSSPTMVPELGVILVAPYNRQLLLDFDAVSRGLRLHDHDDEETGDLHAQPGEYFPDIIHLARLDRGALVSGWDVERSYARVKATGEAIRKAGQEVSFRVALDNTAGILLERMNATARLIGLISLLVALPLLLMAWVLLANLSRLLLLNERRTFGLLRLRGVPGALLGRSLLLAIAAGGLVGGLVGALAGTALPVLVYAGGWLPADVLLSVQPPTLLLAFLLVGVGLALLVGRRFVRFAATISPLEASGRVAASESLGAGLRFGPLEWIALCLGGLKVIGWIAGWSLATSASLPWLPALDRALDFVAFPLFIYGLAALLVSRWLWLARLLGPLVRTLGGALGEVSLRHMATRPHRVAGYLLIVALMASISLYPTVMTAVFDNKTERGAKVQVGTPLQVTLNAPDLLPAAALAKGSFAERYGTLQQQLQPVVARLEALDGVESVDYLVEGLVEGLYMRGYGFNGVPLYVVDRPERYLRTVYHEEALGENGPFTALMGQLAAGRVLISPALAAYWQRAPGEPMPVGRDVSGSVVNAGLAGSLRFLPAMPLASVNDRESFVGARIDYLNYLFNNRAYLVGLGSNPTLASLDVLIPRVVLAIRGRPGVSTTALTRAVTGALPVEPLEVRALETEVGRLGSDMYVFLARQNVQIYLLGGLLLALIGIVAVALCNYAEDRRTLALLRVRGCGPRHLLQFFASSLFAPAAVGLLLGAVVSLVVGYGITNLVWELRQLRTILNYLPTQLAVSDRTALIGALLIALQVALGLLLSRWVFRRTAREGLSEG
jgi:hypothetical protein